MIRSLFCVVLFLFVLGTAQAQTREDVEDLVLNGDFEDGILEPWRVVFRPGGGGDAELTVDEDEVFSKANEAAQRIWKKAESEIKLPGLLVNCVQEI